MGTEQVSVGDIAIANDGTWSGNLGWDTMRYLDTSSIHQGHVNSMATLDVASDKIPLRARRLVQRGDIIYSTVRPDKLHYGIIDEPTDRMVVSTGFVTLRSKDESQYMTPYLYYLLTQPHITEYLQGVAENRTSAYPSIRPQDVLNLRFHFPSIERQRQVVSLISSIDRRINLNRKIASTLESIAQTVFNSWFTWFDPVIENAKASGNVIPESLQRRAIKHCPTTKNKPYMPAEIMHKFPTCFDYCDAIGPIPQGWTAVSVEQAIDINPTVPIDRKNSVPFVDMKALPTSGFTILSVGHKPFSGGARFSNGDVLLPKLSECIENGKGAIVDCLPDGCNAFGSTEFIVMRGKGAISTPYVACLSRHTAFRDHCVQSRAGSTRQRIRPSCFSSFFLPMPPEDTLLLLFDQVTRGLFERITKGANIGKTLKDLRALTLAKVLSDS